MVTSSQKKLGEGVVIQVDKKCATIREKRGTVLVNAEALSVNYPRKEMREVFKNDDEVVFTFKQEQDLVATSIVKKSDLKYVDGKISEACSKFCYVDCSQKKIGKIFVPYSARSLSLNRTFMGKGVEKGKEVQLKIFRQSQPKNQCIYIAWGINIAGEERPEEQIESQYGAIVHLARGDDIILYSAKSGCSKLSYSEYKPWMDLGKFVKYSIEKLPQPIECVPKVQYTASNCEDRTKYLKYSIEKNLTDETMLHLLNVPAIVNRVSAAGAAWFWNDNIGRVYYNGGPYSLNLKPMDVVSLDIFFAKNYEEVPWHASYIGSVPEEQREEIQNSIARYLHTDDDWTVTFVREQGTTSEYLFLNNPIIGAAFAGWTDFAEVTNRPPLREGDKCRVTYYSHFRDKKNSNRAVLVTPLDQLTLSQDLHPLLNVSIEGSELESNESEDSNTIDQMTRLCSEILPARESRITELSFYPSEYMINPFRNPSDTSHLISKAPSSSNPSSQASSTTLFNTGFTLDQTYGTMTDLWGPPLGKAVDTKATQTDDFIEQTILHEILTNCQIDLDR
ncbi:unnamed protein product [Auanema sp. JU1783]|nr:unnamed protein product [Auanema sp. JU1783]